MNIPGELFQQIYDAASIEGKKVLNRFFADVAKSFGAKASEVKALVFALGLDEALNELSSRAFKAFAERMVLFHSDFPGKLKSMISFLTEEGKGRIAPGNVDDFLGWFFFVKHPNLLKVAGLGQLVLPEIEQSDFVLFSAYKRSFFERIEKGLSNPKPGEQAQRTQVKRGVNPITFSSLFIENEGEKMAIDWGNQLFTDTTDKVRGGAIIALWQFLKAQRPDIVHERISDQKACEAIAEKFGIEKPGKNLWSQNKDNQNTRDFYRKLESIKREQGD